MNVLSILLAKHEFTEIACTNQATGCTCDKYTVLHQLPVRQTICSLQCIQCPKRRAFSSAAYTEEHHLWFLVFRKFLSPVRKHCNCCGAISTDIGTVV